MDHDSWSNPPAPPAAAQYTEHSTVDPTFVRTIASDVRPHPHSLAPCSCSRWSVPLFRLRSWLLRLREGRRAGLCDATS